MERSKLKLTVIFLLAVLNLFLLGSVLLQHHQSQVYADTTREQVLLYLQRSGVTVQEETIPWQSTLSTQLEEAAGQLLPGQDVPQQGLPAHCEIQPARETATLLVDFVRGLETLERSCAQLQQIREGYLYNGQGERAVLAPVWEMVTDNGTFLLDCAEGVLSVKDGADAAN